MKRYNSRKDIGQRRMPCLKCNRILSVSKFRMRSDRPTSYCSNCRECDYRSHKEYHERSPEMKNRPCSISGCKNKSNGRTKLCIIHQPFRKEHHSIYAKEMHKYEDKIIEYPDSPTGRAYIGTAKRPLMQAKGGYGFIGVLLQDDTRLLVQCHNCGQWRKRLGEHIKVCSKGMTVRQYREKWELTSRMGLISDSLSVEVGKRIVVQNPLPRGNSPANKGKRGAKFNMHFYNTRGTCPAQLAARLKEFINTNRELPGIYNRGSSLVHLLRRRFGKLNEGFRYFRLPYCQHGGSGIKRYTFPDGFIFPLHTRQMQSRDFFYQRMLKTCPLLTSGPTEEQLSGIPLPSFR